MAVLMVCGIAYITEDNAVAGGISTSMTDTALRGQESLCGFLALVGSSWLWQRRHE
jgi:hypothetical protein